MKYIVILCDGMADYPIAELGGKTPMEVAYKPYMDELCKRSEIGLVRTVPDGMKAGSDVCNLSILGYNPKEYYTGRSPLEALSMGIDLKDNQLALRANLVTVSDEIEYKDKTMIDYSSSEIETEDARILIYYLKENLKFENESLYSGISYRHCLIIDNGEMGCELTPPHDITGKNVVLPNGNNAERLIELQKQSYELLKDHPINKKRTAEGKNPANSLWFWGEGVKPKLENFSELHGIKGSMISAVDLLKGIAKGSGMESIDVVGANGGLNTNYSGKAKAGLEALKNNDFVYIHIEAPDEMGHQGLLKEKIQAIENIDKYIVGFLVEELNKLNIDYRMLICPDHPTPLSTRTHAKDPVPYFIFDKRYEKKDIIFSEKTAKIGEYIDNGYTLIKRLISK